MIKYADRLEKVFKEHFKPRDESMSIKWRGFREQFVEQHFQALEKEKKRKKSELDLRNYLPLSTKNRSSQKRSAEATNLDKLVLKKYGKRGRNNSRCCRGGQLASR
jgi:hypothetical protein